MRRCERRCQDEKVWEKVWRGADVKRSRCEDEKVWRWEDVKMRRCEDEQMWRWEDVREDVKMRRREDEKVWEDVKMRRCEDEKVWEKMWRWEGVKMRRCERRCEDEKVWRWEDEIQTPTIGRTLRSDALGNNKNYLMCLLFRGGDSIREKGLMRFGIIETIRKNQSDRKVYPGWYSCIQYSWMTATSWSKISLWHFLSQS